MGPASGDGNEYVDLDACLALLEGYVELVERFAVIGYMGHLG